MTYFITLQVVFSLKFITITLLAYVIIYWKYKKSGRLLQNHEVTNLLKQGLSTRIYTLLLY